MILTLSGMALAREECKEPLVKPAKPPAAIKIGIAELDAQMPWKTFQSDMNMEVKRFNGTPLGKKVHLAMRQTTDGQDLLMSFTAPSNMRGTSFLAFNRKDRHDRWFMYIRSLRRVKRVPPSAENFMLRDFLSLYLLKPRPELWNESSAESIEKNGKKLIKLVWDARDKTTVNLTGYTKLIQYVDPSMKVIVNTDFFGPDKKLIRKQVTYKIKNIKGQNIPVEFKTTDYSEKVTAEIKLYNLKINEPIEEKTFSVRYLKSL